MLKGLNCIMSFMSRNAFGQLNSQLSQVADLTDFSFQDSTPSFAMLQRKISSHNKVAKRKKLTMQFLKHPKVSFHKEKKSHIFPSANFICMHRKTSAKTKAYDTFLKDYISKTEKLGLGIHYTKKEVNQRRPQEW